MNARNGRGERKTAATLGGDLSKTTDPWPRVRALIHRKLGEGRGQGEGASYLPWFTVREVPSQGRVHRGKGKKSGREHVLLSDHEWRLFHILDAAVAVRDIREQFPLLPLETTLSIAERLDVKHPMEEGEPKVMTSDFLVTESDPLGGSPLLWACQVKEADELEDDRSIEILEIERLYWQTLGIPWRLTTERQIPVPVFKSLEYLNEFFWPDRVNVAPERMARIARAMESMLRANLSPLRPLASVADECDDRLGCAPGDSLSVARHFLATSRWKVDHLHNPVHPENPLVLLGQSAPRLAPDTTDEHPLQEPFARVA